MIRNHDFVVISGVGVTVVSIIEGSNTIFELKNKTNLIDFVK